MLKFSPASRPLEIVNGVPLESVKIPLGSSTENRGTWYAALCAYQISPLPVKYRTDRDDDFPLDVILNHVTESLARLTQTVDAVDDRCDLARFEEFP